MKIKEKVLLKGKINRLNIKALLIEKRVGILEIELKDYYLDDGTTPENKLIDKGVRMQIPDRLLDNEFIQVDQNQLFELLVAVRKTGDREWVNEIKNELCLLHEA